MYIKDWISYSIDTWSGTVIAALFTVSRPWQCPKCHYPFYDWIMKWILFSYKKNEIMNFSGKWMELEKIILSEVTWPRKINIKYSLSSEIPSSKPSHVGICLGVTTETEKKKKQGGHLPGMGIGIIRKRNSFSIINTYIAYYWDERLTSFCGLHLCSIFVLQICASRGKSISNFYKPCYSQYSVWINHFPFYFLGSCSASF